MPPFMTPITIACGIRRWYLRPSCGKMDVLQRCTGWSGFSFGLRWRGIRASLGGDLYSGYERRAEWDLMGGDVIVFAPEVIIKTYSTISSVNNTPTKKNIQFDDSHAIAHAITAKTWCRAVGAKHKLHSMRIITEHLSFNVRCTNWDLIYV